MRRSHKITLDDKNFVAQEGELLLDAAHRNGADLPFDCRAGHCGTCCVQLVSGRVQGGKSAEAGIIHACQSRLVGNVVIRSLRSDVWRVEGVVSSLRALTSEVVEVGIQTRRALPYKAGQYAKVQFYGYPARSFSLTHSCRGEHSKATVWFHIRRMPDGTVSPALGRRIRVGHSVQVTGPLGSAYFRPKMDNRLVLISTATGFAPNWAIACAALNENPERHMLVVAGSRNPTGLYMWQSLKQLSNFPNVRIVPVCSRPEGASQAIKKGRPTDVVRRLSRTDVVHVCGAPEMVKSVQELSARFGATCHADPFVPPSEKEEQGLLSGLLGMLPLPTAAAQRRLAIAANQKQQPRLSSRQSQRVRSRA